MKVAWVTLAVIVASILGLLLINLFGDILVTNQQDYTLMKNAVEAAMYDSKDEEAYEKGLCICTNKDRTNGKYVFNKYEDFYYENLNSSKKNCSYLEASDTNTKGYKSCYLRYGEFKINKEVFAESFVRRFAESVKGDTEYKLDITDISEYPPKVSVMVTSYDNYQISNSKEATFDASDYSIVNSIDSIIENFEGETDTSPSTPTTPIIKPDDPEPKKEEQKNQCKKGNVRVVLVIDTSTSIKSAEKGLQKATNDLIKKMNNAGIKVGYVLFNKNVVGSKGLSTNQSLATIKIHEGSYVGKGIGCGLKILGLISDSDENCKASASSLTKDSKNYMILLSDGHYKKAKYFKIPGKGNDTDGINSLATYINNQTKNRHFVMYAIGYNYARKHDVDKNRLIKLTGSSSRVKISKDDSKLTDLSSLYNQIFSIIDDNCK